MAKETPKGFVLLYDYKPHLALLNDEERGQLLMALLEYGENGTEPNLSGMALMAFSFIRGQLDRDMEKYRETCEKRSKAGQKGGRPPKTTETPENNGENEEKPPGNEENSEKQDLSEDITENQTDFEESKESICFSEKANESKKTQIKNKNKNKNKNKSIINNATTPLPPPGENSPAGEDAEEAAHTPYQKIVDLYHELCPSYPQLRNVSENRKKAIAARWKEYGGNLEIFRELFTKAEASNFLKGQNPRKWSADFNWLMNSENMAKVLEGKYANKNVGSFAISSFDTDEFYNTAVARTLAEFEEMERRQEQEGRGRFAKTAAEDPDIQSKADDLRMRLLEEGA